MEIAKITLIGPLSLAVGRFRFKKGVAVSCTDKKLIQYAKVSPRFKVEELEPTEEKPKRKRVRSSSTKLSSKVKTETTDEISEIPG